MLETLTGLSTSDEKPNGRLPFQKTYLMRDSGSETMSETFYMLHEMLETLTGLSTSDKGPNGRLPFQKTDLMRD